MRSEFELIQNPEEAQAILVLASTEIASASFWVSGNSKNFFGLLSNYSSDNYSFDINLIDSTDLPEFSTTLKNKPDTEFLVSVTTSKAVLFFKCLALTPSSSNDPNIRFRLPTDVYRVQRRQHLRYTFLEEERLLIKIQKLSSQTEKIIKYLNDLSAGGFSLLFPLKIGRSITSEDIASGVELTLKDQTLNSLKAVVRHKRETTDKEGAPVLRVGFEFTEISDHAKNVIQSYVTEKIRSYFQNMNSNNG